MANLAEAGLNLRTIDMSDLQQASADINHNNRMILTLPAFMRGQQAVVTGVDGQDGERGNVWLFINGNSFIEAYDTITNNSQINTGFLTVELSENREKLLDTLGIEMLVEHDLLVTPSKDVIQYNLETASFVQTGVSFRQQQTLSEDDVRIIVQRMVGNLAEVDPIQNIYNTVAKNAPDTSGGQNTVRNEFSALDVPISGAGAGITTDTHRVIANKESYVSGNLKTMQLLGSLRSYHNLVQATLNNKSVEHTTGINNFHAQTILQNDYNSGILLGYKDAVDFSGFAQIYQPDNNKLRLQSKFISDNYLLFDNENIINNFDRITNNGSFLFLNSGTNVVGKDSTLKGESFEFSKSAAKVGKSDVSLALKGKNFELDINEEGILYLGTDKLVAGLRYKIDSSTLKNDSSKLITHNLVYKLGGALYDSIDAVSDELDQLKQDVGGLAVFADLPKLATTVNTDINHLSNFGSVAISKPKAGKNISNLPVSDINNQNNTVEKGFINTYQSDNGNLMQELFIETATKNDNGLYLFEHFVRTGIKAPNGSITWHSWQPMSFESRVSGGNAISVSRGSDGIQIVHENVSTQESTSSSFTSLYVSGISVNSQGHVTKVQKHKMPDFATHSSVDSKINSIKDNVILKDAGTSYTPKVATDPVNKIYVDGYLGTTKIALESKINTVQTNVDSLANNVLKRNNTSRYVPTHTFNPATVGWCRAEIMSKLRSFIMYAFTCNVSGNASSSFSRNNVSVLNYNEDIITRTETKNSIQARRTATGVYELKHNLFSMVAGVNGLNNLVPTSYGAGNTTVNATGIWYVDNDTFGYATANDGSRDNQKIKWVICCHTRSLDFYI